MFVNVLIFNISDAKGHITSIYFIDMTSGLKLNTNKFQLTSFPACAAISSHFSIPVACSILSGPAKM